MKKYLAVILTATILFAMAAPAFAGGTPIALTYEPPQAGVVYAGGHISSVGHGKYEIYLVNGIRYTTVTLTKGQIKEYSVSGAKARSTTLRFTGNGRKVIGASIIHSPLDNIWNNG